MKNKINYKNLKPELLEIAQVIHPILDKKFSEITEKEVETLKSCANKLYFLNDGVNKDEQKFIESRMRSIDIIVNAYIKNSWKR